MAKRGLLAVTSGCLLLAAVNHAAAQVVHLPVTSRFGVSTTVWVPDRGSTSLGGVASARDGASRSWAGLGLGSERSLSQARVHATLFDFEAMERDLLANRNGPRPIADAERRGAELQARIRATRNDAAGATSLAELRAMRRRRQADLDHSLASRLQRADALWIKGEQDAARRVYRDAYEQVDEAGKKALVARFRRLTTSDSKVASRR